METIRLVKGSAAKVCLEADLPAVVSAVDLPAAASVADLLAAAATVADLLVAAVMEADLLEAAVMEADLLMAAVMEADPLMAVLGTGDHVGNRPFGPAGGLTEAIGASRREALRRPLVRGDKELSSTTVGGSTMAWTDRLASVAQPARQLSGFHSARQLSAHISAEGGVHLPEALY